MTVCELAGVFDGESCKHEEIAAGIWSNGIVVEIDMSIDTVRLYIAGLSGDGAVAWTSAILAAMISASCPSIADPKLTVPSRSKCNRPLPSPASSKVGFQAFNSASSASSRKSMPSTSSLSLSVSTRLRRGGTREGKFAMRSGTAGV